MADNQKKFSGVDYIDIFSNNFSRFKKHLFIPAITGIVVSFILIYIFSSAHFFGLNSKYFVGFFDALFANMQLQDTFVFLGQELPTQKALNFFEKKILDNLSTILFIFVITFISTTSFVYYILYILAKKSSKKVLEEEVLQGSKILKEEELIKLQKKDRVSGAPIGHRGAKFNKDFETQHCFISGASGTGKTILMRRMYTYYINNKQYQGAKYLIHDVKGDYVQKFYNKNIDYIFNLNDSRTFNLNLFNYINTTAELKSIVASIIPQPQEEKDPIWTNSARSILEGIMLYCIKTNQKTNKAVQDLIKLDPETLAEKLSNVEGTEDAVTFLSSGSEGQIGNIYSNFKSRVTYFTSLPQDIDTKEELNIKKWLTDTTNTSTIFLLNDVKNKDLNAIRIAVFLNIVIKELLTLTESKSRKIFFMLDEFGSLQKMQSIVDLLALGRSFGARVFIGIQEIQRLYAIYGKDLTSTIVNNTSSKIILRANEVETAEYCAKLVGEVKKKETNLTNTTGADLNSNREGASFANIVKTEKTLLASDLMQLENNTYIYKNGSYPWTKIQTKFIKEIDEFENINEAFMENTTIQFTQQTKKEEQKQDKELKDYVNQNNETTEEEIEKIKPENIEKNAEELAEEFKKLEEENYEENEENLADELEKLEELEKQEQTTKQDKKDTGNPEFTGF